MACHCRRSEATARAMDSSTWNGMVLRTGTDGDAAAAAALHAGQISEGFLTFLGPRFLAQAVPEGRPDAGLLPARRRGRGDNGGIPRRRPPMWPLSTDRSCGVTVSAAALASGGRLLRSWRRVMETLRHGTGGAGEGAELLAVAVDPMARGRGAGTLLVEGFLTEVGRRRQRRGLRGGRSGQRDCGRAVPASRIPLGANGSSCIPEPSPSSCSGGASPTRSRDGGGPARRNGRPRCDGGVACRRASWSPTVGASWTAPGP